MNKKHQQVIEAIFKVPIQASIPWKAIESALIAIGAEITEGNGSRIRVKLNGVRAIFHRPHPRKEIDKGAIVSMRRFLTEAGVKNYVIV